MRKNTSAADKARFKALMAEFQEAATENLDEDEKLLIRRIAESTEAPSIFAKVKDDVTAKRLLSLCVEAHYLAKNFHRLVSEARQVLAAGPEHERAIADVEKLLRETQAPTLNRLTAYTPPDSDRIALEWKALESIKDRMAVQLRTADETILRLGATHKSHGKKAADIAAIGWMAEGIKRITKKTNSRLSADLAELVLGCEVSLDRVDNAAETRKREWRGTRAKAD
jgi:hypothetical protein